MRNPFRKDREDDSNLSSNTNYGADYRSDWKDSSEQPNQTVWQGDCYHSYRSPGTPTPQNGYQEEPSPTVTVMEKAPKKRKKHILRNVLAGLAACLVVSASSITGFAYLINTGTIKMNSGSSSPAFTIVKDSASSKVSTTNTGTSGALTLEQVASKVVPSVVCIQNYQVNQSNAYAAGGFGSSDKTSEVSPASEGSGIIATSDGYIITNAHVVDSASSLKVILSTGKTYQAKLVGSDSVTDLAVIKIDATGLTAAEFGSSGDLQVADQVMAVGNPGGLEFNSTVTIGYVSALNREISNTETGYTMKCIQTDAAINPGNSGGALVNMKGQVVGINSSKIVATGYEGLGFSLPINEAQPIISDLKQYGYVKDRAVLGISGQFIDSMTSRFYGLPEGMYVSSISSSAVTSAGIQKGDVITKIDGTAVTSLNVVTSEIAKKKPGETVTLSVTRALTGQTFTATVKLAQATGS
ncbi:MULTISPECIES: S1C family serine protease [Acutalibacteraceae]|uniref:S1C family serine protease n=1 Tax=Acutalibacteraceae TaxID=3082771 RepID=UPI001FA9E8F8|nr:MULTISPECIES: trypsin-like peptidase domain-containing protein [Acutalibacteraceae]